MDDLVVRKEVEEQLVENMGDPLFRARGWMKFIGVLSIITGVMQIFTIWGILICWLPIWMGVTLCQASSGFADAYESLRPNDLKRGAEKLATYFTIMGVITLIGMIIMGIGIAVLAMFVIGSLTIR